MHQSHIDSLGQLWSESFGISGGNERPGADRGMKGKDKGSHSLENEYSGAWSNETNSMAVCKSSHFSEPQFSL